MVHVSGGIALQRSTARRSAAQRSVTHCTAPARRAQGRLGSARPHPTDPAHRCPARCHLQHSLLGGRHGELGAGGAPHHRHAHGRVLPHVRVLDQYVRHGVHFSRLVSLLIQTRSHGCTRCSGTQRRWSSGGSADLTPAPSGTSLFFVLCSLVLHRAGSHLRHRARQPIRTGCFHVSTETAQRGHAWMRCLSFCWSVGIGFLIFARLFC